MRILFLGVVLFAVSTAHGQTLSEILKQAETNYPLLKSKYFEVNAAKNSVASVKNSALPNLDAAYQVNYATYNNITGMASPEYFVPISGPPSTDNSYTPVYGSAASLLMNWEAFTFGQRSSRIDIAKANLQLAEADARYEVYRHKVNVIQTYFDLLLANELSRVYQKNLDRSKENLKEIETLTRTGLRPGVDTALFSAELSRAKIEILNYEKYLQSQELALSELIAAENFAYQSDSSYFHKLPSFPEDTTYSSHPLIVLSTSNLEINKHQLKLVRRTLYPKLSLWGTAYARGSGISYDGFVNSEDGLSFSRYNYGVGLQLSIPLLRFIDVRPQLNQQDNLLRAQEEKNNHVKLQLDTQTKVAILNLKNALTIAAESPVFYNSAKFSFDALQSRYNAGLANYADLLQAQYGLLKAESDLKKSYLDAWKALLYLAVVKGDLTIFLNQLPRN